MEIFRMPSRYKKWIRSFERHFSSIETKCVSVNFKRIFFQIFFIKHLHKRHFKKIRYYIKHDVPQFISKKYIKNSLTKIILTIRTENSIKEIL